MAAASVLSVSFHLSLKVKNRLSSQYPRITGSSPLRSKRAEVFKSMENWAEANILVLLKPVEKSWQPHDILPDPACDGFFDLILDLQNRAKELPDELLVALVGDMVAEEALPTYQSVLNAAEGFTDESGSDLTPFQAWSRGWSAEENRHGDVLNQYLYLTGRVDMKQVDKTTHYLIKAGMDLGGGRDPYLTTIYTSFQERATFITHRRTAHLAHKHGNPLLAQICSTIASDEKRHEIAYTKIVHKIFQLDPTNAVLAFADMMRTKFKMPGHLMFDGKDEDLFANFAAVSSRIGVYTASDYIDVMEHLVETWKVEKLTGLSGEGRRAQEYVCGLPERLRKVQERVREKETRDRKGMNFSWIFGKGV